MHVLESQLGRLIMRYLEAYPVLLNLEALRVDSGKDESPLDWKMALVPQTSPLSKLYIVGRASQLPGDNKSEVERSLINSVIKRFPRLKIFELHSLHYALTPGVGKFPRLPIFNSLVDLRVTSVRVNHNTLDWASRLPSLQHLAIPRAYSAWFTSENIQPNRLYLFGALTVLRIDWDPHVATLLASCRFPSLIEFSLNCERLRGSFDSPELHSLASLISRHSPKIKTLKIRAHLCRDDNELVRYLGKYQTLQLSTLRLSIRLDEITIKFSDLNEVIAEHWPQLSHLAWEMRHLSLQEVAETIVCHPHLMSLAFDAMCGPWIKPVNVVSLASTLPLDLYCYIVDRQHMNAEEVAR
ncbi:hypothetical protein CTheo_4732 [Ceratobasidium theobromae]|uniref:Uncharacterized protein n=1 Tax=Ceratobasidium theobromae TaxID=1582974 RepID=A0A5N5QJL0_9AGAM|nr:hypothetical protein CTheo_4732 [Ceratobasidium theobromae]